MPSTPDGDAPWVTASEIGQATYCPYQLYLAKGGLPPDASTARALESGTRSHAAWNVERRRVDEHGSRRRGVRLALLLAAIAVGLALLVVLASRLVA